MKETKFKNTEIGIIPENWAVNTLAELCSQITDGSHESPKDTEYGYYMPSVKDMRMNEFNFANCKKISEKDYLRLINNGCKPQKGDVLIAKDGSILKYSFTLKEDLPIVILSSIAIIRPRPTEIESEYLSLYFRQPKFIEQVLTDFKTGTGVPRIILRNFEKIQISYPYDLTEQYRIASALTSIDSLISSLGKLIEKKKNIKQGTMQQLLTGQIHLKGFKEPWEKRKLGDNATIQRGGSPRPIEAYLTTNRDGINWIKIGDVRPNDKFIRHTAEKIIPEGISHSRQVYKGDFILSNSMSFGRPYILDIDGCIHDGWLVIKDYSNTYDMDFLYYILSSDTVFEQYIAMAAGSSVKNLNKEKVANVMLFSPQSLAEQRAIAIILTKMDNEITALEAKRAKYEAIKQGMMQQLLTGKIRLIG